MGRICFSDYVISDSYSLPKRRYNQNIPSYSDKLRKEFIDKSYKFPLFYGRMERILADIAFMEKQYDKAMHHYGEGLYLIALHGGYGEYTVDKELKNIDEKLQTLPADTALNYYNTFKKYWTEKGLDKKNPMMISWLDDHINTIILQKCQL